MVFWCLEVQLRSSGFPTCTPMGTARLRIHESSYHASPPARGKVQFYQLARLPNFEELCYQLSTYVFLPIQNSHDSVSSTNSEFLRFKGLRLRGGLSFLFSNQPVQTNSNSSRRNRNTNRNSNVVPSVSLSFGASQSIRKPCLAHPTALF